MLYQKKLHTDYPLGTRVTLWDEDGFFALAEADMQEEESVLRPIKQFRI